MATKRKECIEYWDAVASERFSILHNEDALTPRRELGRVERLFMPVINDNAQ